MAYPWQQEQGHIGLHGHGCLHSGHTKPWTARQILAIGAAFVTPAANLLRPEITFECVQHRVPEDRLVPVLTKDVLDKPFRLRYGHGGVGIVRVELDSLRRGNAFHRPVCVSHGVSSPWLVPRGRGGCVDCAPGGALVLVEGGLGVFPVDGRGE